MMFDLVRPIEASKGELEINTLLDYSPSQDQIEWAPEIEYAYANEYAVELEFPVEDTKLEEYKLALQGTFGRLLSGKMIHGWQIIGRRKIEDRIFGVDILYLNSYRFSNEWVMMNMLGFRKQGFAEAGESVGLINNSLFYSFFEDFSIGIEVNSEIRASQYRYRVTPQLQGELWEKTTLQFGGGPSKLNKEGCMEWMLTSRVVYSF